MCWTETLRWCAVCGTDGTRRLSNYFSGASSSEASRLATKRCAFCCTIEWVIPMETVCFSCLASRDQTRAESCCKKGSNESRNWKSRNWIVLFRGRVGLASAFEPRRVRRTVHQLTPRLKSCADNHLKAVRTPRWCGRGPQQCGPYADLCSATPFRCVCQRHTGPSLG